MGDGIPVDDVLETVHHFRAIDYVIDIAEDELTEDIIKHLHYKGIVCIIFAVIGFA